MISQYNQTSLHQVLIWGTFANKEQPYMVLWFYDFEHMRESFVKDAVDWYEKGLLNYTEDLVFGIEKTPAHFIKLMKGENFGKTIVQFMDL
jgi:Putative NADP-dependent oxidoreductases